MTRKILRLRDNLTVEPWHAGTCPSILILRSPVLQFPQLDRMKGLAFVLAHVKNTLAHWCVQKRIFNNPHRLIVPLLRFRDECLLSPFGVRPLPGLGREEETRRNGREVQSPDNCLFPFQSGKTLSEPLTSSYIQIGVPEGKNPSCEQLSWLQGKTELAAQPLGTSFNISSISHELLTLRSSRGRLIYTFGCQTMER